MKIKIALPTTYQEVELSKEQQCTIASQVLRLVYNVPSGAYIGTYSDTKTKLVRDEDSRHGSIGEEVIRGLTELDEEFFMVLERITKYRNS